jgi:flagellar biosynthesis GTPase FlhF
VSGSHLQPDTSRREFGEDMEIKTFRAKSMRDVLDLVRRELGPSAAVLHTREVNSGPLRRLVFGRKYEVAASAAVNVPSRLPANLQSDQQQRVLVGEVSGVRCQMICS